MTMTQQHGAQPGDNTRSRSPLPRSPDERDIKVAIDRDSAARSLGALVLTVVELLRELMERQAIRRFDQGDLTPMQVEHIGATLMALDARMNELCQHFEVSRDELNLDLGPLGLLLSRD
jgi:hypothetical protein